MTANWKVGVAPAASLTIPGIAGPDGTVITTRPIPSEQGMHLFRPWVQLPEPRSYSPPRLREQVKQIRAWTGWSQRRLARVLNTTHPTIKALEQGRNVVRVQGIEARIADVFRVVERVFIITDGNPRETNRLLSTTPGADRTAGIDLLIEGDPGGAYLAALRVRRPPAEETMMVGRWPSEAGGATRSLEDAGSS